MQTKAKFVSILAKAPPYAADVTIACVILAVRLVLNFRFPIPWPDETSFIVPAFELSRHGTLFVWAMNADRLVMWMPPGYFVFLAVLFKMFGYSFGLARWASAACVIGAALICGSLIRRCTAGGWAVMLHVATVVAFVSPYMLMSANIGRMDALLSVTALGSLAACLGGYPILGGAIVAAAATIQFNAVFFVLPFVVYFIWLLLTRQRLIVQPLEIAGVAFAAAVLGVNAILVQKNLQGFIQDMAFQFRLKRFFGHDDPYHPFWPVLAAGIAACAVLVRQRRIDGPAFMALYGLSFVLMATEGKEIWYDMAPPLGFLLIAIALAAHSGPVRIFARPGSAVCLASCLACIVATGFRSTPYLRPLLPTRAMLAHHLVPERELRRMRDAIAGLPAGSTVEYAWPGVEPFFLDAMDRTGVRWDVPQHSVTDNTIDRRPDWRIQCDSPDTPDIMFFTPRILHHGRVFGCDIGRP